MMRLFPLLTTHREFSIRARFLVAIFALVQFIAPTWHVCEMGGNSCCPPQVSESLQHCASRSTPATPKPHCAKCPQVKNGDSLDVDSLSVSAPPAPHVENCLAKMLIGMPLQQAAPIATLEFSSRRTQSTPALLQKLSIGDLPQSPSRAPPVFSL